MRTKRWLCLLMALALLAILPVEGLAAKKSISLGIKVGLIYEGGSVQLSPRVKGISKGDVRFESSDKAVATVSASGRLQALSTGRAIITVSGGGLNVRCGVVVLPKKVCTSVGGQVSLPNGGVEKYRMKDMDIATIDSQGIIAGVKEGTTMAAVKYGKQILTIEVQVKAAGELCDDPEASLTDAKTTTDTASTGSKAAQLEAARTAEQIVLVEYTGGSSATLSVHEKVDGAWVERLSTSAYVGKNGIGKEKEGDKKTPVGTYNLTTPFGIKADPGSIMPYTQVTKYHYWCGASNSGYYNQLVDSRVTGRSYTSSDEHLIDYKGVYNYCMFIDYNASGTPGKGSCIFLHCKGSNPYTAGCVAISEESMKKIIRWAKPGVVIVIQ